MSREINKSAYFQAVSENATFKTPELIAEHAQKNQSFTYGTVCFNDFSKKYSCRGWGARKVAALPLAAWSGLVQTIYHLCKLIFLGLPAALCGKTGYLKASAFSIVRDLQEGLGRFILLFNDKYGVYLVQKSTFHKECYQQFTAGKTTTRQANSDSESPETSGNAEKKSPDELELKEETELLRDRPSSGDREPHATDKKRAHIDPLHNVAPRSQNQRPNRPGFVYDRAPQKPFVRETFDQVQVSLDPVTGEWKGEKPSDISLWDFREASPEKRIEILNKHYHIRIQLDKYVAQEALDRRQPGTSTLSLANQLKEQSIKDLDSLDENTLKACSLLDLVPDPKISALRFAKMSDEEFRGLTAAAIANASESQVAFIKKRLADQPREDDGGKELPEHIENLPLNRLTTLTAAQVNHYKKALPAEAFLFFSNDQLQGVEIAGISGKKIYCIFDLQDEASLQGRLALFRTREIAQLINDCKLGGKVLTHLSDEHIVLLDIGRLHQTQIETIFKDKSDNDRRRFACFADHEVLAAIRNGALTGDFLNQLLSEEQIGELKLSKLTEKQIKDLFPEYQDRGKKKKIIDKIKKKEVCAAIEAQLINESYLFRLLSEGQVEGLKLSKLTKKQITNLFPQFGNHLKNREIMAKIENKEVYAAIKAGLMDDNYLFALLSDKQIEGLRLSQLTEKQIKFLFPEYGNNLKNREIMAKMKKEEVYAAIEARLIHESYLFGLLSEKQIEDLKLSKLTREQIKKLFPEFGYNSNNGKIIRLIREKQPGEIDAAKDAGLFKERYLQDLIAQ